MLPENVLDAIIFLVIIQTHSDMAPTLKTSCLIFNVRRKNPQLLPPARPTPKEHKLLSDIDDQEGLRFQFPAIHFYRKNQIMIEKDPVKVIRDALSEALVFYYPFAGRLREGPDRKLVVECTGEGIMFIEGDADVSLEEFGEYLQPPFPCLDEIMYDVPGSGGILHCPLLLIQVTRLTCGGFILAARMNHTISDFAGLIQFMSAAAEIARGASAPSILPVWQRQFLSARNPPKITCTHHEYDQIPNKKRPFKIAPFKNIVQRNFFFGPTEISAMKKLIDLFYLEKQCSKFDVLTAFLWRCWCIAVKPDPLEEVRVLCAVNARSMFDPPLPDGYYGNGFAMPAAVTTAERLCSMPLSYALDLVMKAKSSVNEEYMRSVADLTVIKGKPDFTLTGSLSISDVTRSGYDRIDFGWGKAVYGGPPVGSSVTDFGSRCFYISHCDKNGEKGILVLVSLPEAAMERLVNEIKRMLNGDKVEEDMEKKKIFVKSAL